MYRHCHFLGKDYVMIPDIYTDLLELHFIVLVYMYITICCFDIVYNQLDLLASIKFSPISCFILGNLLYLGEQHYQQSVHW